MRLSKSEKAVRKYAKQAMEEAGRAQAKLVAGALASIHASKLTADELKQMRPNKFDKMENRILKMLTGWSIHEIEYLLTYRVLPEAKRRAKVPK